MRDQGKETSPWVWIATGCGGCLVLVVLVVVGAGYFGFRAMSGFRDSLMDPEIRTERVPADILTGSPQQTTAVEVGTQQNPLLSTDLRVRLPWIPDHYHAREEVGHGW